jgi:hypothetical protein
VLGRSSSVRLARWGQKREDLVASTTRLAWEAGEPEIILRDVKLYHVKGDREPTASVETIRIIAGPNYSAGSLVFVCVNLTPLQLKA